MIEIYVVRDEEGFIWQFEISGHAFYAEGPDIVCAAVSVTAYTAVGALGELLKLQNIHTEDDGYMHCSIPPDILELDKLTARIILETTVIGFKQIEMQYPKNVKVIEEIV
jgi:uncharacterized protein YsxB (DUF464 family)